MSVSSQAAPNEELTSVTVENSGLLTGLEVPLRKPALTIVMMLLCQCGFLLSI